MGRKRGRRRAPFKLRLKKDTTYTVASLCLIGTGLLIIVSFAGQGLWLDDIQNWQRRQFGIGMLFLPYLLITAGLMLTQLKWRVTRPTVFLGGLLIFLAFIGLARAGSTGQTLNSNLSVLIHPYGSTILFFIVGLAGIFILTESSINDLVVAFSEFLTKIHLKPRGLKLTLPHQDKLPLAGTELKIEGGSLDIPHSQKQSPAPPTKTPPSPLPAMATTAKPVVAGASPMIYQPPPMDILEDKVGGKADRGDVKQNAAVIEQTLESFGIRAKVVEAHLGPAVTQYALQIALGTKLSRITTLQNDLALALAAPTGQIRIEAPIPGKSMVGIEIPNRTPEIVTLKQMLSSKILKDNKNVLAVGLGLNVAGKVVVADFTKMPHVLIAGATGSGKSVAVNAFISQILFRASPEQVKFIMVDPKRVELTQYNGIPHLLTPVIVDPEKVVAALQWAIEEMENRYKLFAEVGVRNIEAYNSLSGFQVLPYLVIIIDELADVILFNPNKVEDVVTRLAQMARATGIHLLLATQRPSVDVITGLIKANIPCRIAFNVTSMIDSRVIIDSPGAEKLLGRGDMLYIPPDQAKPSRIQGAFVSEPEIKRILDHLISLGLKPQYTEEVTTKHATKKIMGPGGVVEDQDELFEEAVRFVAATNRASASLFQRKFSIGYARAARVLDQLQQAGVVGPGSGAKPRQVLVKDADAFFSGTTAS
ncbi:hypothetical protein A2W24_01230 [Microgenomates group bacterium RBG_16_45_19]|nr:MAG: hypothetical protein A2W24_01230 [Microgenomates group bacterium RBG_16_45_19]